MQSVPLFEQLCCNAVTIPETLEHSRPCQLEMEQFCDDDNRMQVDSFKKGKVKGKGQHKKQEGTRTSNTSNTDMNTSKNCGRTRHWVKDCGTPGVGAYDNSNNNTNKGKNNQKSKDKGKTLDVVQNVGRQKQPQPCRIPHRPEDG